MEARGSGSFAPAQSILPTAKLTRTDHPSPSPFTTATTAAADVLADCALVAANSGCSDICAYKFDVVAGGCRTTLSAIPAAAAALGKDAPIIGGTGKYRYQYMPELLKVIQNTTSLWPHLPRLAHRQRHDAIAMTTIAPSVGGTNDGPSVRARVVPQWGEGGWGRGVLGPESRIFRNHARLIGERERK